MLRFHNLLVIASGVFAPTKNFVEGGGPMRKRLFLIVMVLAVGLGILLAKAGNTFAVEGAIVKIWAEEEGTAKGMHADPPVLTVKKNTIVIWMNGVPGKEIQIVFEEGKTCRDITANPNLEHPGFFMDSKNCYVTSFLPYTETSTLQFPEAGGFDYTVLTNDNALTAKGRIVVEP
jgi:hypothetical protein